MIQRFQVLIVTLFFCGFGFGGERILGHISSTEGGFTPGMVIANTGASTQNIQLLPYTQSGEKLATVNRSIDAGATQYLSLAELFGREDISHVVIEGDEKVTVSTTYQSVTTNSTPVHVHETAQQSQLWRIYPGTWSAVWDGIAVVNTSDSVAEIVIVQKDREGQILASQSPISLQPYAKHLTVLNNDFSAVDQSHFELSSSQPTAVTALRGSLDNRFLWTNLPIPQDQIPAVSQESQYEVRVTTRVKYGEGLTHSEWNSPDSESMDLFLDVYEPIGAEGPRPAVMFIHGGGFRGGARNNQISVNFANYFASRGFVCFSISYRLTGHKGTVPDPYYELASSLLSGSDLDQVLAMYTAGRDAKAAVRWIRANADVYKVDVNRITAAGGSAGAITAVTLGTSNPEDFKNELTLEQDPTLATTNLDQDDSVHSVIDYWGSAAMMNSLILAYDLEGRYDKDDSPLIIIHGTEDPVVTYDNALDLERIYTATGATYELYPLQGEGHSAWNATVEGRDIYELAFDFVTRIQNIAINP